MDDDTQIATVGAAPVVVRNEVDQISRLLQTAIEKEIPVEALEKIVALHERVADREAAKEFASAMALFQSECPPIPKKSTAVVKKDGVVQYTGGHMPAGAGRFQYGVRVRPALDDARELAHLGLVQWA